MTSETSKPSHLDPSALGTKEYWDNLYNREISNHALDATDVGTIWFDDSSAEDKVVDFLNEEIIGKDLLGLGEGRRRGDLSLLDLGTGNGHFLVRLREDEEGDSEEEEGGEEEEGKGIENVGNKWIGRMMGVDYSERSIEFARRIAEDKREEKENEDQADANGKEEPEIEFITWDIMKEDPSPKVLNGKQTKGWDIVLDKGTFDAISLSEETDTNGKRIFEGYKEKVLALVRVGGVAVVTSCNWTEGELIEWFVGKGREEEGERFDVLRKIEYRSFSFGGVKGQTTSINELFVNLDRKPTTVFQTISNYQIARKKWRQSITLIKASWRVSSLQYNSSSPIQATNPLPAAQIKNVIQDLYEIMVQVNNYDNAGRPTRETLEKSLLNLSESLQLVSRITVPAGAPTGTPKIDSVAGKGTDLPWVPADLIQYVDNGRNPDIYTREFVEAARKNNQLMRGKMQAFAGFRDVLAGEMGKVFPELEEDVRMVVEATSYDGEVGK
ncbi:S-adenosylmethionine-dependent methyltransferase-like protein [Sclerotinia borealis F-4128]|uniref:Protein-lysine N-methyltransferase EFM4 n=1 Tax=Sclerotinia borealis (strain F-4128) TaxID=1432307 RepID=W9CPR5_SCLBF|nr:S-adenosylmethionine-dependent methyltransferase-like protein [Sclerotinia borealis F-4128]